jgi:hypothetical protein
MKAYWESGGIAPRIQRNSPWYPLDKRLGGPQSRSGCGGEEKNFQPLPGLEPPDHPARNSALYRWAIPAAPFLLYDTSNHVQVGLLLLSGHNQPWSHNSPTLPYRAVAETKAYLKGLFNYCFSERINKFGVIYLEWKVSSVGISWKLKKPWSHVKLHMSLWVISLAIHTHTHTHTHTL